MGERSEPTGIGAERRLSLRGGTEPAPYQGNRSSAVYGGVRSPRPTEAPTGRCGHRPLRIEGEATSTTWGSGAERSVCGADGRNEEESEQRSPPKGPATPDNPSVSLRLTAPFPQGSLRDGGCGLPRRPCGPPRNDNRFLSFRGAERRGNPSFLRWTGVRAAVPRAWPPPTKFRPEIWGVGQVVGPCGKPNQPPKPAGAQRSVRARGREGWAGIGAKTIPKRGGPPRDRPGSA